MYLKHKPIKKISSLRPSRIAAIMLCLDRNKLKKKLPGNLKEKKHPLRKIKEMVNNLGLTFFSWYWKLQNWMIMHKRVHIPVSVKEDAKKKHKKHKKKDKKVKKLLKFIYAKNEPTRIRKRGWQKEVYGNVQKCLTVMDKLSIPNPYERRKKHETV